MTGRRSVQAGPEAQLGRPPSRDQDVSREDPLTATRWSPSLSFPASRQRCPVLGRAGSRRYGAAAPQRAWGAVTRPGRRGWVTRLLPSSHWGWASSSAHRAPAARRTRPAQRRIGKRRVGPARRRRLPPPRSRRPSCLLGRPAFDPPAP